MFEKSFGIIVIVTLLLASSLGISAPSAAIDGGQGLGRSSIDAAPQPSNATWSQAGYPGEIPYSKDNVINVKDAGAVGDGATNDYAAIQAAINAASAPAVIFFPAGRYRFESRLELKSGIVLRGEGYKLTHLECLNTSGCISMTGSRTGGFVDIQSGLAKGSNQIVVADASGFTVGQGGGIQQDDIVPAKASWGENAVGQMVKILAINGNTLTIDPPLHIGYSLSKNPIIRPIRYVEQVGIEDLHLKRLDSGSEGGNNISMTRTADCWIRRVESEWTEKYHIAVSASLHLEVRDSYIHHAYYIGDGGQGYGVSLAHKATSILVENNIFNELRHSMIIQLGTNGCVFGYNYAQRNYSDDGWDKSYISVHGHYPFMNLFEGNIVGWAVMDSYWGANGPDNTFFRNRVVGTDKHQEFGPYRGIWVSGFHGPQYIVGNEIQGQDGVHIYSPTGDPDDIVIHGNNVLGVVTWDPTIPDHTLPASYYLASKPGFYGEMQWPSMGGDKTIGEGKIPALVRWEEGEYIPSANGLILHGTPANEAIHLTWTVEGSPPPPTSWQISFYSETVGSPVTITGIASDTRAYPLTGLTNYTWYTVTLSAMVDNTAIVSDTVRVMPTGIFVHLPLILKD